MGGNPVYDYIIELVNSIKGDRAVAFEGERWAGSKYLLGQIIRQYCLPRHHYFVSKRAKELWDALGNSEDILDYSYQKPVRCCRDGIEIREFVGNSKSFKSRTINSGDEFTFRSVFHDEHVVPVNVIIDNLCSFPELTYDDITDALNRIRICKMLKSEDKDIRNKSNRSLDYRIVLNNDYKNAGVQEKVDKMFGLVESTQKTVDTLQLTFERSSEKIDKSLDDLSDAMSNFSEFTRIIMENPSALFGTSSMDEDKK